MKQNKTIQQKTQKYKTHFLIEALRRMELKSCNIHHLILFPTQIAPIISLLKIIFQQTKQTQRRN
jgi:hypothetical protein